LWLVRNKILWLGLYCVCFYLAQGLSDCGPRLHKVFAKFLRIIQNKSKIFVNPYVRFNICAFGKIIRSLRNILLNTVNVIYIYIYSVVS
jgi:hypothetical protein